MNNFYFNILNIVLIIIFLYIIIKNIFFNNLEAFSLKDITKEIDKKVSKVEKKIGETTKNTITKVEKKTNDTITKVGKKTNDTITKLEKKTNDAMTKLEKKTIGFVTQKLTSVFDQLGDIFNDGLIKPMTSLFTGIGNIFVQIFKILGLVVNKIVSLPSCIFTYVLVEAYDAIYRIYKSIMPNWLKNIISKIYKYTIKFIVDFLTKILGIDDSIKKCYGFNINKEMDSINSEFKNINNSFKKDFGKLNFKKIKV